MLVYTLFFNIKYHTLKCVEFVLNPTVLFIYFSLKCWYYGMLCVHAFPRMNFCLLLSKLFISQRIDFAIIRRFWSYTNNLSMFTIDDKCKDWNGIHCLVIVVIATYSIFNCFLKSVKSFGFLVWFSDEVVLERCF